jgi:hypothetical protein
VVAKVATPTLVDVIAALVGPPALVAEDFVVLLPLLVGLTMSAAPVEPISANHVQ